MCERACLHFSTFLRGIIFSLYTHTMYCKADCGALFMKLYLCLLTANVPNVVFVGIRKENVLCRQHRPNHCVENFSK